MRRWQGLSHAVVHGPGVAAAVEAQAEAQKAELQQPLKAQKAEAEQLRQQLELWTVQGPVKKQHPTECHTGGGGAPPKPPPPPLPRPKAPSWEKNEIYNNENVVGPFLVHNLFGALPPPAQKTPWPEVQTRPHEDRNKGLGHLRIGEAPSIQGQRQHDHMRPPSVALQSAVGHRPTAIGHRTCRDAETGVCRPFEPMVTRLGPPSAPRRLGNGHQWWR